MNPSYTSSNTTLRKHSVSGISSGYIPQTSGKGYSPTDSTQQSPYFTYSAQHKPTTLDAIGKDFMNQSTSTLSPYSLGQNGNTSKFVCKPPKSPSIIPAKFNTQTQIPNDILSTTSDIHSSLVTTQDPGPSLLGSIANYVMPNQETPIYSHGRVRGHVKSYGTSTNRGIVRPTNEDRIAIYINLRALTGQPENWPKVSFFGVFDGHGGDHTSDYLKSTLHELIIGDSNFPERPETAVKNAFAAADAAWLERAASNPKERSAGSAACVVLTINNMCYIANAGDCRAVLSSNRGKNVRQLSNDHKPLDPTEYQRIVDAGGRVSQLVVGNGSNSLVNIGPYRVFPGGLSLSRSIGDLESKDSRYGGMQNTVISEPEIMCFEITKEHDFIVLASDGIFDVMTNQEVIQMVYETATESYGRLDAHAICGAAVDNILKLSLMRQSQDNVSVVIIAFEDFVNRFTIKKETTVKTPATNGEKLLQESNHRISLQEESINLSPMKTPKMSEGSKGERLQNTFPANPWLQIPTKSQYHSKVLSSFHLSPPVTFSGVLSDSMLSPNNGRKNSFVL